MEKEYVVIFDSNNGSEELQIGLVEQQADGTVLIRVHRKDENNE